MDDIHHALGYAENWLKELRENERHFANHRNPDVHFMGDLYKQQADALEQLVKIVAQISE